MLRVERQINPHTTVVAEGETPKDLFQQIVSLQEVFGEDTCGKCQKNNLRYKIRRATDAKGKKEYFYHEIQCRDCYAKLSVSEAEGGVLFPVRWERKDGEYVKDKDGRNVPRGTYGWVLFNKETGEEE